MKLRASAWIELAVLALTLGATLFWLGQHLSQGLAKENRLTGKRLEQAFLPLLTKAHRMKDDLALQEAISALAQAPGIAFACVLDPEEKVLAHSRLDQLGKTFSVPREAAKVLSFPLKDETDRWGTLVFALSTRTTETLNRKLRIGALLAGALLLGGYVVQLLWNFHRRRQIENALVDEQTLRAEKETQIHRLDLRLKTQLQETQSLLAMSLERLAQPVIVLDSHQRVIGLNPSARQALDLAPDQALLGSSWQDIGRLQNHGQALGHSLQHPSLSVPIPGGFVQTLEAWTWVTLSAQ